MVKKTKTIGPSQTAFRSAVDNVDVADLVLKAEAQADLLARIAQREETRDSSAAIRAAQGAARVLSDVISGLVIREQLDAVSDMVAALGTEDVGGPPERSGPQSPRWFREAQERRQALKDDPTGGKVIDTDFRISPSGERERK